LGFAAGITSTLSRSMAERFTALRASRPSIASMSVLSLGLLAVVIFGSGRDPVDALIERPLVTSNAYCASPLIQTDLAVGRMIGQLLPTAVSLVGEGVSPSDDIFPVDTFGEGRTDQPQATVLFRILRSGAATDIQAGAFQANGSPFGAVEARSSVEQRATIAVSARTVVRAQPSRSGAFLLISGTQRSALLLARLGDAGLPPELVLLDGIRPDARSLRVHEDTALVSFAPSGGDPGHQIRALTFADDGPLDESVLEGLASGEFVITPEGALVVSALSATGDASVVVHRSIRPTQDEQPAAVLPGRIVAVDGSPGGRSVLVTDADGGLSVLTVQPGGSVSQVGLTMEGRPLTPLAIVVRDGVVVVAGIEDRTGQAGYRVGVRGAADDDVISARPVRPPGLHCSNPAVERSTTAEEVIRHLAPRMSQQELFLHYPDRESDCVMDRRALLVDGDTLTCSGPIDRTVRLGRVGAPDVVQTAARQETEKVSEEIAGNACDLRGFQLIFQDALRPAILLEAVTDSDAGLPVLDLRWWWQTNEGCVPDQYEIVRVQSATCGSWPEAAERLDDSGIQFVRIDRDSDEQDGFSRRWRAVPSVTYAIHARAYIPGVAPRVGSGFTACTVVSVPTLVPPPPSALTARLGGSAESPLFDIEWEFACEEDRFLRRDCRDESFEVTLEFCDGSGRPRNLAIVERAEGDLYSLTVPVPDELRERPVRFRVTTIRARGAEQLRASAGPVPNGCIAAPPVPPPPPVVDATTGVSTCEPPFEYDPENDRCAPSEEPPVEEPPSEEPPSEEPPVEEPPSEEPPVEEPPSEEPPVEEPGNGDG